MMMCEECWDDDGSVEERTHPELVGHYGINWLCDTCTEALWLTLD